MEFLAAVAMALWLGVLTSISPCPMATNIAAISYIARRVDSPRLVLFSGLLYTAGRTLAYLVLGIILAASVLSESELSDRLEATIHRLLGPILILVAMFLLELITFGFGGGGVSERMQRRIDSLGIWGAALLGILFALSFCPTSLGLFLTVTGMAVSAKSDVVLPSVYGIGTALPVIAFAILIALSAESVGKAYNVLAQVAWWARRITGIVFLAVGLYCSLTYTLGVQWLRFF